MIEDPEGPHAHHGTGIKWLDIGLALAVVALSGASLITAQHTGHTMERLVEENSRLVRANSTPVLQFVSYNVGDRGREITFNVSNVGTGAARIIWFELARGGVPLRNYFDLIGYQPDPASHDYVATTPVAGTYFPAHETRQLLAWKVPSAPQSLAVWSKLDHDRFALVPTACFCSILNECWTSHLGADVPQPVKACDARGHVSFKG